MPTDEEAFLQERIRKNAQPPGGKRPRPGSLHRGGSWAAWPIGAIARYKTHPVVLMEPVRGSTGKFQFACDCYEGDAVFLTLTNLKAKKRSGSLVREGIPGGPSKRTWQRRHTKTILRIREYLR